MLTTLPVHSYLVKIVNKVGKIDLPCVVFSTDVDAAFLVLGQQLPL